MMLTSSDFEQARSPRDLRDFVLALKDTLRADESERHLGMLKKGLYKKFLDEIVPLNCFAVLEYQESCRILPVLGNQGFDAIVLDETGKEIDRIEMTCPGDGAENARDARLVVNQGHGTFRMDIPGDDFDTLFSHVLATCRCKAMKDYSDCTLVVAIEPLPPFPGFEARYESQIAALVRKMELIEFKAKRVMLMVLPDLVVKVHR